jgi:hypothetical protein
MAIVATLREDVKPWLKEGDMVLVDDGSLDNLETPEDLDDITVFNGTVSIDIEDVELREVPDNKLDSLPLVRGIGQVPSGNSGTKSIKLPVDSDSLSKFRKNGNVKANVEKDDVINKTISKNKHLLVIGAIVVVGVILLLK